MSRKITTESINAFLSSRSFNKANMSVEIRPFKDESTNSSILKLHGNVIALMPVFNKDGLEVCDGNWQTVTTKERLNGLPGVSVCQRKGQWFLNGKAWDGSWVNVQEWSK